uniref:Translation initiation factor IF-3, mitochondrial n=1 Tax=Oryzias latipes TaxID=8090 RepID=A0A3P9I2H3_ORYLA
MSAACVRWLLSHAAKTASSGGPLLWTAASRPTPLSGKPCGFVGSWSRSFSTEVSDAEKTPSAKKKKQNTSAHASISNVGRKIPHREIQVISESGENLGTMHRAEVIKIMDQKSLKLVLLSENEEPPVYQLMSGKQIHEEQLRQREKNKTKAPPPQVKELTFSLGIAPHDLSTKLKQAESWLEKKHHVRMTVRGGRAEPAVPLDAALEQMVEQMDVMVGFVSKPKVIKDGRAAMCVLRPPSAKELSQKERNQTEEKKAPNATSEVLSSTAEESMKQ